MKRIILAVPLLLALLWPAQVQAQATHQVVLTWVLSTDDTTSNCTTSNPCSQNVYRAAGVCSSATSFGAALANLSATATTYTDTAVSPGQVYCYGITFVDNTGESPFIFTTPPTNMVSAKVQPFPPTNATSAPH